MGHTTNTNTSGLQRGADLRERRVRLGVSRPALAGMAGCSVTTLANIETGYVPARSTSLLRLQRVLANVEASAEDGAHD